MIVASRYAKSLLDLAIEKKQLDVVYKDMILIKNTCDSSHELQVFLKSPVVKIDKKIEVFKALFESSVSELTGAYLNLIANKKRATVLAEIIDSFIAQYKTYNKITIATITSAVKLDDSTRKKALSIVKAKSDGEVELVEKVNPELIGGFILRIGDDQIDNSVSRQLANLKKNFNTKTVSIN
jgi:F-type H+-transporting ATPase subunit delta